MFKYYILSDNLNDLQNVTAQSVQRKISAESKKSEKKMNSLLFQVFDYFECLAQMLCSRFLAAREFIVMAVASAR